MAAQTKDKGRVQRREEKYMFCKSETDQAKIDRPESKDQAAPVDR